MTQGIGSTNFWRTFRGSSKHSTRNLSSARIQRQNSRKTGLVRRNSILDPPGASHEFQGPPGTVTRMRGIGWLRNGRRKAQWSTWPKPKRRAGIHLIPLLRRKMLPIVPGFVCRTTDGKTATLGRNGSDYSAAIVGGVLRAKEILIYTDVDGVMTADPNLVAEATCSSANQLCRSR